MQQVLEGLLRFDAEGRVEPALAERWERLNDATVRFYLRKNVTFHNGEPFDARAVKFSLEKYVAPETRFPALGFVATIASVTVINDHVVDVLTHHPDGLLLNRLAAWIHIVPPQYYANVGDQGFAGQPVGTGPFRFERWDKNKEIVFARNPDYWMKGYPKVDRLVFAFIAQEAQVDALLKGEVDLLTSLAGTRTTDVQKNKGTYVLKKPTFYTIAGNFNISRPPFSNKRIREAVNLAVDRKALIRYDIFGNGIPLGTLSFPDEFGHNSQIKPYPYNPKKARQILKEEGYPAGFALKVFLKVNAERTGRIIAKQLDAIGITLNSVLVSDAEIFEYLKDRGQWDMMIYDCPDTMSHAFFVRSIFLSGESPFSLAPDQGIDERLRKLTATLDPQEQAKISEDLDRHIYENFLALPTYQRIRTYGLRRAVEFTPYVLGMPYFYAVNIRAN
ncbi:MAG: ABC transporter substrate-binding protein [Elusimicrobia bacterium]|nr:ABC transporter substrate-binding protein [Elusimicrobiota bacterium]